MLRRNRPRPAALRLLESVPSIALPLLTKRTFSSGRAPTVTIGCTKSVEEIVPDDAHPVGLILVVTWRNAGSVDTDPGSPTDRFGWRLLPGVLLFLDSFLTHYQTRSLIADLDIVDKDVTGWPAI